MGTEHNAEREALKWYAIDGTNSSAQDDWEVDLAPLGYPGEAVVANVEYWADRQLQWIWHIYDRWLNEDDTITLAEGEAPSVEAAKAAVAAWVAQHNDGSK